MARCKAFAREHLGACARDAINWQTTGVLASGSRLRELGDMVAVYADDHNDLSIAESLVTRAALEAVADPVS